MATLANLKPSISELPGEEVLKIILESRDRRRKMFLEPRKIKQDTYHDDAISDLSQDELQSLLDTINSQIGE